MATMQQYRTARTDKPCDDYPRCTDGHPPRRALPTCCGHTERFRGQPVAALVDSQHLLPSYETGAKP